MHCFFFAHKYNAHITRGLFNFAGTLAWGKYGPMPVYYVFAQKYNISGLFMHNFRKCKFCFAMGVSFYEDGMYQFCYDYNDPNA